MSKELLLGKTVDEKPIALSPRDRGYHLHVLGGIGSGKSTSLEMMIRQDINYGRGVLLLDPHGELYTNVLRWCATHRVERRRKIFLFEPADTDWTFGFNPLDIPSDALVAGVSRVENAFARVWRAGDFTSTPQVSRVLSAILYLLAEHRLTIADAGQLRADRALCKRLGDSLVNQHYREEWADFNARSQRDWTTYSQPAVLRLNGMLASDVISRCLQQKEHTLNLAEIIEDGGVLLVNLTSRNNFTPSYARIFGTLLVNELYQRALVRKVGARPFYAYIDECYHFLNEDVENMLVQTRKYGVHITLAHQHLDQLAEQGKGIAGSVMAIQNKLIFGGLRERDTNTIAKELFASDAHVRDFMAKEIYPYGFIARRGAPPPTLDGAAQVLRGLNVGTAVLKRRDSAPQKIAIRRPTPGISEGREFGEWKNEVLAATPFAQRVGGALARHAPVVPSPVVPNEESTDYWT